MNEQRPSVIEAEEIRLVDSDGRRRALIVASAARNGEPSITLYDDRGHNRLVLELHDGRPRVTCYSPSGQPIAGVGQHDDSGTTLVLSREDGRLGFLVRVPPDGDTVRLEFDRDGQPLPAKAKEEKKE